MKAEIVMMNPMLAKELLKANKGNRPMKDKVVKFYTQQMLNGEWMENGEAIIVDVNGVVKDGQHRLQSVINADFMYRVPLITDVHYGVMATIDTGSNRTLGDVLELNQFKYSNQIAALVRRILKWKTDLDPLRSTGDEGTFKSSNLQGLEYAAENVSLLTDVILESRHIRKLSDKAWTLTELAFVYWLITEEGTNRTERHRLFLKMIAGVSTRESNAASYVHRTKLGAKMGNQRISGRWLMGITLKAWNSFVMGDPIVKYLKFDVQQPLPRINKL